MYLVWTNRCIITKKKGFFFDTSNDRSGSSWGKRWKLNCGARVNYYTLNHAPGQRPDLKEKVLFEAQIF